MSTETVIQKLANGKGTITWRSLALALLALIAYDMKSIKESLASFDKRLLSIELTYVKR